MSARLRTPRNVLAAAATLALSGALSATALQAQETVRFFTIFDAVAVENWEPVIAEFEKQHPDLKIELETVAGSGAAVYPDVLRTSMASGDPADVFFMWGGSIAEPFIDAGQVKELSAEYYAEYGWKDRFPAWIMDALTVDGKLYGVPFHARGMGFWYRKDMFEEIRPHRADDLCRARGDLRQAEGERQVLRLVRRQVRLAPHAPRRLLPRDHLRPGGARPAQRAGSRAGTSPASSRPTAALQEVDRQRLARAGLPQRLAR